MLYLAFPCQEYRDQLCSVNCPGFQTLGLYRPVRHICGPDQLSWRSCLLASTKLLPHLGLLSLPDALRPPGLAPLTSHPFLLRHCQKPRFPANPLSMNMPLGFPNLTLSLPLPAVWNPCAYLEFTVSHEQFPYVPNFLSERAYHLLDLSKVFCPLVKQHPLQDFHQWLFHLHTTDNFRAWGWGDYSLSTCCIFLLQKSQLLWSISKVPKSTGLQSTEVQKYRGSASKVLALIIYFIIFFLFFRAGGEICG